MIRTLLAALDGTAPSDRVLDLGISWARRFDATLAGCLVVDEPGLHGSEEWLAGESYFRQLNQDLLAEMDAAAGQAAARYQARCAAAGVTFRALEREGRPVDQIREESQRFDLILVGQETHFRFGWADQPDGTAGEVLRDTPRPVVVVPDAPADDAGPVVLAYDGSHQAARAASAFEATGLGTGRVVWVVAVGPDGPAASRHAGRAVDFLAAHGLDARADVVVDDGPPAPPLLGRAAGLGAGLLVMGAYGQPALKEFFVGSTTRTVLRTSRLPVFLTD